jgi:hypothetical protein
LTPWEKENASCSSNMLSSPGSKAKAKDTPLAEPRFLLVGWPEVAVPHAAALREAWRRLSCRVGSPARDEARAALSDSLLFQWQVMDS